MNGEGHSTRIDVRAARLKHVRWIGGGSGAGKTTVAEMLAAEHGLRLYDTEPFSQYVSRTTPASAPMLHSFVATDMDERWVNRSPQVMFETFHAFHGEWFELVVEDLLELPTEPPVLVEGFTLVPRLVVPLLTGPTQAVWLLPTAEFRRAAFDSRGTTWTIPRKTSDPHRALANVLSRDQIFSEAIRAQATALDTRIIEVDRGLGVSQLAHLVAKALALNPGSTTPARR